MNYYLAGILLLLVVIGGLFIGKVVVGLVLALICFLLGRFSTKVIKVGKL